MSNRTIMITGGSGKFGVRLVEHFLATGDQVIATVLRDRTLERRANDHAAALTVLRSDFTKTDAVTTLVAELAARGLRPDCLVNNARSLNFLRADENGVVSRKDFTGELLVDVVLPYELTMALALAPHSQLRRVVNVGSQYGVVATNPALYSNSADRPPPHYGVAKAALIHLTRELAVRLAESNIQVNCASFGGVEGRVDEDFRRRYAALTPQRRMLTEAEIIGPIDFLLSDCCSAMTGHNLIVDGGWTAW